MNLPVKLHPGSFASCLECAATLADAADRLAILRVTSQREADALQARWKRNQAAYFAKKDQSR